MPSRDADWSDHQNRRPRRKALSRNLLPSNHGDATKLFPNETAEPDWLPIVHVNRVFYEARESPLGHCTMFDFDLISQLLKDCGFRDVKRKGFQSGDDPVLLIDTPGGNWSLCMLRQ